MPEMDGYEVAWRIREKFPKYGGITLVALTGWGRDEDRQRTSAAGFDHHLTKPVDIQALQALLANAKSVS
jgi:CheY-like chemotaxis protein